MNDTGPEPTEFDLGCYFHGYEGDPSPETPAYKMCFECGHIWWTEEQFLTEFNDDIKRMSKDLTNNELCFPLASTADEIFFCCWCAHDF